MMRLQRLFLLSWPDTRTDKSVTGDTRAALTNRSFLARNERPASTSASWGEVGLLKLTQGLSVSVLV